ncbi:MAG: hypothetical protein J1F16_04980 [Muribaculaceae bacterium]|nr:hypothetical protein [Muribaculaceae bacterium]
MPEESVEDYETTEPWCNFLKIEIFDESQMGGSSTVEIVVSSTSQLFNIYNLKGVMLKHNATHEDINNLAPGLYIIDGRKVLVK